MYNEKRNNNFNFEYTKPEVISKMKTVSNHLLKTVELNSRKYCKLRFKTEFTGPCYYDMVTHETNTNSGYEFEANVVLPEHFEKYDPEVTWRKVFRLFEKVYKNYAFSKIENDNGTIVLKKCSLFNREVICTLRVDVIALDYGLQRYIRSKDNVDFKWDEYRSNKFDIEINVRTIKNLDKWDVLRKEYLQSLNTYKGSIDKINFYNIFFRTVNDFLFRRYGTSDANELVKILIELENKKKRRKRKKF